MIHLRITIGMLTSILNSSTYVSFFDPCLNYRYRCMKKIISYGIKLETSSIETSFISYESELSR